LANHNIRAIRKPESRMDKLPMRKLMSLNTVELYFRNFLKNKTKRYGGRAIVRVLIPRTVSPPY
jgi:hypothetical protein